LAAGEFPALGLDFEAGGVLIAAAQFDGGLTEAGQEAQLAAGRFVELLALAGEDGGKAEADGGGEMVGEGLARGDGCQLVLVVGEVADLGEDVVVGEPLLVAAKRQSERFCSLMGRLSNLAARTFLTSGREFNQWTICLPSWPSWRRMLS